MANTQMTCAVIIPVKNGAGTLEQCLHSIKEQDLPVQSGILVLDSASTDSSVRIAESNGARILPVEPGTFNHGLTRNAGVASVDSDLIYFTVQDASIPDPSMLRKMAAHFDDPEVMAVMGHQAVPHHRDKNPMQWTKRYSTPVVQIKHLQGDRADKEKQLAENPSLMAWDNVVAMYRRDALLALPFADTAFGEDWIWCRDALLKGLKLVYDPSLVVHHYHHQDYDYTYNLHYTIHYHFYKHLGILPERPPLIRSMKEAGWHLGKNTSLSIQEKLYWLKHNYLSRLAALRAYRDFMKYQRSGMEALEQRYRQICRVVPQGKLRSSV